MLHKLLHKLIKGGAGRSRFVMAAAGLSVALLLILGAVQLQVNYNSLLYGKSNQDSIANFLVINKVVNNQTLGATTLSTAELADLRSQPFIDGVGLLTPSRFKLSAESVSEHMPFYSELFFESVPDEFIDVTNDAWRWNEQSQFIPMIIPNMFLDLYNFGFATSQSLPQLTQDLVKNLPIKVNVRTGTTVVSFYAKVVGFSDRISSILVPQSFMDWANNKYGSGLPAQTSRVVIRTRDAGNPALTAYLRAHELTTDADKTRFSKYRQIVDTVVNISGATGIVMLAFALLVFTLFIQLTIASCKDEIVLLVTIGAAPAQLYRFLMRQFFPSNVVIVGAALVVITVLQWWLAGFLSDKNMELPALVGWPTVVAALLILLVLWIVNRSTIRKYISIMDKKES
ncbi:FtsX-like permease family protein [Filimonas effusa]|uniref:FtsX-like permease family protein n=1 Tax=Filimonas effusa TaxID=2508721 RepID=A0A4Q1D251_9BACT|nr:FtsX-like permease family protein [Filimonas effusa]RXK81911.1 FtsX-like permease family protein [Filimonas effusa]